MEAHLFRGTTLFSSHPRALMKALFGSPTCPSSSSSSHAQSRRAIRPVMCQVNRQGTSQCTSHEETLMVPRRELLGLAAILAASARAAQADELAAQVAEAPSTSAPSEEFATLSDDILAYSFRYPATLEGRRLNIIPSRKPERYSSAAPLTADARQRIVAELVSFQDTITISVSVGPPSGVLKSKPLEDWTAREVADTVLQDRSTARVSTGQRVSLNSVEQAAKEERDGQTYWTYEHLSQGSPSIASRTRETYRHAWSVTGHRPGLDGTPYLYTLTLSCPDEQWPKMGALYESAQQSFRLTKPTREYVPPDKDPWRFF